WAFYARSGIGATRGRGGSVSSLLAAWHRSQARGAACLMYRSTERLSRPGAVVPASGTPMEWSDEAWKAAPVQIVQCAGRRVVRGRRPAPDARMGSTAENDVPGFAYPFHPQPT